MFGPDEADAVLARRLSTSSFCSSSSPVSAKPDGISTAVLMPLSPTLAIVSGTNLAGMQNTATSTPSGRSSETSA